MRNIQKNFVQKVRSHIVCSISFLENLAVYEIKWEKRGTAGQATGDSMAHAHCMLFNQVTNTHSEYVIVTAFPLQYVCTNAP